MKKEHIAIVSLVVVVVVILLFGALGGFSFFQPKGKEWVFVHQWRWEDNPYEQNPQSNFNTTTEQFIINGEEWRIQWACSGITGGSHFDITVYDAYTDNKIKEISTTYPETMSGESYLNNKGRFYLKIYIQGTLDQWTVTLNEFS